ncbi:MAG: hypothetical protein ACI4S4_06405 [Candidatus Ornithospirochaeta sp.]
MKRLVAIVLLLALCFSLSAETLTHSSFGYKYESYSDDEFPIWTIELRRAETIFFGSFVFTVPVAALALGAMEKNNLVSFNGSLQSTLSTIGAAAGVSLFIAGVDWILGRMGK